MSNAIQNAVAANTANTAITPKATTPGTMMEGVLSNAKMRKMFDDVLRDKAPAFIASIIDLYSSDTYLAKCDAGTVARECLKAATLDLPINKQLGFAYVVPYAKNGQQIPQFQLGYKGYIQLAQRTGAYRFINADIVYEGELKSRNKLTGVIDISGERTGDKPVGYFAYIETINGFAKSIYMSVEEVRKHAQRYSKSYGSQSSAWVTNFDDMALKTCVRRLISKWGIMSVEMVSAVSLDAGDISDMADRATVDGALSDAKIDGEYDDVSDVVPVDDATGEVIEGNAVVR